MLISQYYSFIFLTDWSNFTIFLLNANSRCWDSVLPCWCYYLMDKQTTAIISQLMTFGYLSYKFPKCSVQSSLCLQRSQYRAWTLCFPFLHYYLTHMYEQPGVIKCLEAHGAKVQYWHRKTSCTGGDICSVIQTCQLKTLVLDNLCPLARIHLTCQQGTMIS